MLGMRLMRPAAARRHQRARAELGRHRGARGARVVGALVRYSAIETLGGRRRAAAAAAARRRPRRRPPGPQPRHDRRRARAGRPHRRDRARLPDARRRRRALAACTATREIPIEEFLLGPYTTALEPDELLVAVRFPRGARAMVVLRARPQAQRLRAARRRRRPRSPATDGAWRGVRIGLGGRRRPRRCSRPRRRDAWRDRALDDDAIAAAAERRLDAIDPPDDVRAIGRVPAPPRRPSTSRACSATSATGAASRWMTPIEITVTVNGRSTGAASSRACTLADFLRGTSSA